MKKITFFIYCVLFATVTAADAGNDLLIKNARLIDATGAPPRQNVSIRIRGGMIVAIDDDIAQSDNHTLDAGGATVLPGMIDSHVHLLWGPDVFAYGQLALLGDDNRLDMVLWQETLGKYLLHYMRAYLACGITTVLDATGPFAVVQEVRRYLNAGYPGPRYLPLGPGFAIPGGHGDGGVHSIRTVDDVYALFNVLEELETVGAKVFLETVKGEISLSEEIRETITSEAQKRNLPLFIHARHTEQEQLAAIAMQPRALVHSYVSPLADIVADAVIDKMSSSGIYQMTTFSIIEANLLQFSPDRLQDPLLDLVVPATELAIARDPNAAQFLLEHIMPWLPKILRPFYARMMFNEKIMQRQLQSNLLSVQELHAAGVPIVMGSDTIPHAYAIYQFHGPSSLREVELIGEAGLTAMESIQAATVVAAEMLGLEDEIGTVEVGKRADLVIVQDDPLKDLGNLSSILWTVQNGIAKTPEQWMNDNGTTSE